jgi:hypothetical protein
MVMVVALARVVRTPVMAPVMSAMVTVAWGMVGRLGGAECDRLPAAAERSAQRPHGVPARRDRCVDRRADLVARQDAAASRGTRPVPRVVPAARVMAPVPAGMVSWVMPRMVSLVLAWGSVRGLRYHDRSRGTGRRVAENADGVADDRDRRLDRDADLVAAEDTAVAAGGVRLGHAAAARDECDGKGGHAYRTW